MQALLKKVRLYLLTKLVGEVDREALLAEATKQTIDDLVQNGFTPEDEAAIDAAAAKVP